MVQPNKMTVLAELKLMMADTGVKGQDIQAVGTYLKIPFTSVTVVDERELAWAKLSDQGVPTSWTRCTISLER